MQEYCIRFIMSYKFSQIKRNDSRQSSQSPLSHVPPTAWLWRYIRETISDSFFDLRYNRTKINIIKLWQRHVSDKCNISKELWNGNIF